MRALRGEVDKMQSKSVNGKRAEQPRNGVCLYDMRNVWEYTSAADSYTTRAYLSHNKIEMPIDRPFPALHT